jgi:hypothetical protein
LSAAIVSENFRPSSTSEQALDPVHVPESVLLVTVPLIVGSIDGDKNGSYEKLEIMCLNIITLLFSKINL